MFSTRRLLLLLLVALATFAAGQSAHADQYVKLSTASQVVYFGPFIDDTDFKTAKTALSIANTDIKCLKRGATSEVSKNSGGGTHIANGRYYATMDATDTNTLGSMRCSVKMTAALEVWETFQVVSANVFDNMFGSTIETVNATQIAGDSAAATALKNAWNDSAGSFPELGISDRGTAQSVTSTTIQLRSAATLANSEPIGQTVWVYSASTGAFQSRTITAYVGSTDTATVDAWTTTPTGTIKYVVWSTAPSNIAAGLATLAKLDTCLEADGGVYRASLNCLEQAPAATSYNVIGAATSNGSTTSFVDTGHLLSSIDDAYVDWEILWTGGANAPVTSLVTAYNGTTKGFTLAKALPNVVSTGNAYLLVPSASVRLAPITHTGATLPGVEDIKTRIPSALTPQGNMPADTKYMNGSKVNGSGVAGDSWRGGS